MKNKAITPRNEDFARWYDDIVKTARLATYSSVKGCNSRTQWVCNLGEYTKTLDAMFKETGHQNVNMPVFIPESLLKKNLNM